MTNDELADAFAANLAELHEKIAALPDGGLKIRSEELADVAHRALERLKKRAVDGGQVQPFSGGDPKSL